ncbi:unnamed protein product [Danaus chrysippus]|uniref:Small RNA 2'-O-methyltransferase n=1 Tax=Danaus chrysippus TaxID=151541 RepID=A0A8J2QZH8_9NEOP|nr:unnamed protein product [Danaus chrysippus]
MQIKGNDSSDDEDSDDHVFSEYDEEKGVVFYPPVYIQRYAAVSDCLMDERWRGKLEKVVDIGYHDMSFIKYLIDMPGIKHIMGVDIDPTTLRCSSELLESKINITKRDNPLKITLFQGNAADPDFRLIGCDAVVAIEMIEHMLPHDLERLIHTVFGFIKPQVAIFTTPNGDFNVLFKALEDNGLRRTDHFFEWSKEQFHDWCSNIVLRYPQYTVTTKGIGPGPPGTSHIGCCSQLAMFMAKSYHKQDDLDVNSLALVPKLPTQSAVSDMIFSCNSSDDFDTSMLCLEDNINSFTELLDRHSCMTLVLTSPSFSCESIEYEDKTSQCNLDIEFGKNFLMFDDDTYYDIRLPSRQRQIQVYEIEDVACRLNCSTLQVKKFSKETQNLLIKNKTDALCHTSEVIDEIKYITKMLNFNKDSKNGLENHSWCNINWGENAPYWNQYYKVIREYDYPYETKSDDCRILDVISEKIDCLLDEIDSTYLVDGNKLEIPVTYLMDTVRHITSDVDKVKELLEWNGYEIKDDVLVHPRLDIDNISIDTDTDNDWTEDVHDWNTTDAHLSINSECNAIVRDIYDRSLHRAIDRKVLKLRSMFIADEDITSELDKVVCRLMKLALNSRNKHRRPPSVIWLQYKLFGLLTLTEKAIEKRRCHMLNNFSIKAIEYCKEDKDLIHNLNKIKQEDQTAQNIVSKYYQLVPSLEDLTGLDDIQYQELHYQFEDSDFDDITSNEFKGESTIYRKMKLYDSGFITSLFTAHDVTLDADNQIVPVHPFQNMAGNKIELSDWDSSNLDLVPYTSHTDVSDVISSDENNLVFTNTTKFDRIKTNAVFKYLNNINSNSCLKLTVASQNKVLPEKLFKNSYNMFSRNIPSKSKVKKLNKKSKSNSLKRQKEEYNRNKAKEKRKPHEPQIPRSIISDQIPDSPAENCNLEFEKTKNWEELNSDVLRDTTASYGNVIDNNIANTEICVFLNIVSEQGEETVALQRNIGTDPDSDMLYFENEILLDSLMNVTRDNSFYYTKIETDLENLDPNTIFLNDINEPSTSKGVRHLSTDVQCGPDVSITNMMLSASTSFTKMSKLYTTGIKIGDSCVDIPKNKVTYDFGTCTETCQSIINTKKSIGIKIKDSDINICKNESATMTEELNNREAVISPTQNVMDPKPLKSASLSVTDECSSHVFESVGSLTKSHTRLSELSRHTSDLLIQSPGEDKNLPKTRYIRPKLSCGGVHVHSYKDRIASEDLVYQGEWQRSKLKTLAKKNPNATFVKKTRKRSVNVKDNPTLKDTNKKENKVLSKTIAVRSPKEGAKKYYSNKTVAGNLQSTNLMKTNKNVTKVASKITTSSTVAKNTKNFYSSKQPFSSSTPKRNVNAERQKTTRKNYLPLYLRKRLNSSLLKKQSEAIDSKDVGPKLNLDINIVRNAAHVQEFTKDLLLIPESPHTNLNYIVFRNDIETNKNISTNSPSFELIRNDSTKRLSSASPNSSTCSSPNSVATVRAASTRTKSVCNRKNATSSDRSNSGNLETETRTVKNKKYTRRVKTNKKSSNIIPLSDNKENLPESSRNTICLKDNEKNSKKVFVNRTKSIYMAQVTNDASNLVPVAANSKMKSHSNKAFKYMSIKSPDVQKFSTAIPSVSTKKSCNENSVQEYPLNHQLTDMDDLSVPPQLYPIGSIETTNRPGNIQIETNKTHISDVCSKPVHQTKSSILSAIRKLVEGNISKFETNDNDGPLSDSETVIISRDDLDSMNFDEISSLASVKTVPINEGIFKFENDADNKSNVTENPVIANNIDSTENTVFIQPDVESDLPSFKSMASISTPKFSEFYLADNELETVNTNSVQDIFERKDPNIVPSSAGVLAVQAFSGFSVNLESLTGDQPDHVNLVDSETGSLTLESARQTASEELFVSGRSSDTYESCLYDDEADVPNWLFNIISHQQSIEESEAEDTLPVMVPLTGPDFEINGNVEPGVGLGAGAGDGRGIHSDHSQDSSGRGSSLSSTPTSSGPQSEVAVLVDSSAFTAQSVFGSMVGPTTNAENEAISVSVQLPENNRNGGLIRTSTNTRSFMNPAVVTSDVDADVSSLDTDAMDSDN